MPDLKLPEATWGRPPGRTAKRKRPDPDFDIAIDTDSQVDRFKRQNIGSDTIDLTPSHRIPDVLGSQETDPTYSTSTREAQRSQLPAPLLDLLSSQPLRKPSISPSSQPTTLPSEPQSPDLPASAISELETLSADNQLDKPNDKGKAIQKWDPKVWDENEFDSDEENMSLAVTMKLANELSLLKSFLGIYRKFNIHLGDIVSGPRHKGFLFLIFSTVTRLESHTTHLRALRNEKLRGSPTPSTMELIAEKIFRKSRTRRDYLWDIMEEKVDMTNVVERAIWVKKKKAVLGDVMGGLVEYLEELGDEEGWKEREVREMGERWEKRWRVYGAMDRADLKKAGWILDVGNRDG